MAMADRVIHGGKRFAAHSLTDGTTPTLNATAALYIDDDIVSTQFEPQDSGAWNTTVNSVRDNATLNTYFETYKSVATSGAIEELLLEDGTKEAAQTSSNQTQIVISRGGLSGNTAGNARKVMIFTGRLANSSGGFTQEGEKYNRVTMTYEGYKLSGAVTVGTAPLTSFATTPASVTLSTSFPYGRIAFQ